MNGHPVLGDGGPIVLPPYTQLEIGQDGTISVLPPGQRDMQPVDRLKLVQPADAAQLTKNEAGLIVSRNGADLPASDTVKVTSGHLESSNVSAVEEMVATMSLNREFEIQMRLYKAADSMAASGKPPDLRIKEKTMNPAMWISKTGVQAQDAKLQAIANNIANVNTVGFKRDRVVMEDMFYQIDHQPGTQTNTTTTASPIGVQLGNGTRLIGTQKVFTTGSLQTTSQSLDVAIVGKGFFRVLQPNGETAYTRAGQLQVNAEGLLVNAQGRPLQPEITIPANATSVTIGDTGAVSVTLSGATTSTEIGQITLSNFVNPAGLLALGENLYQETSASGAPTDANPGDDGLGKLKQGALEGSNVQVVEEMVDMIAAQRTYEMNTKVLSAADNMMQNLSQAVR